MDKKKESKILQFTPNKLSETERQVEAILFAAEEPLDEETIQSKVKKNINIKKILDSLQNHYSSRGINLVCILKKWSFRTAKNLSSFMNTQKSVQKKLSRATIETLATFSF